MWTPLQAMLFGFFSALSLPLGALIGIVWNPVSEQVTARFMAFGSGAVIFAVATQLYGDALSLYMEATDMNCGDVGDADAHFWDLLLQIVTGIIGAGVYYFLNKWLQRMSGSDAHSHNDVSGGPEFAEVRDAEQGRSGSLLSAPRQPAQSAQSAQGHAESSLAAPLARAQSSPAEDDTSLGAQPSWKGRQAPNRSLTWHGRRPASAQSLSISTPPRVPSYVRPALSHQKSRLPPVSDRGADGSGGMSAVALSMWLGVTLDGIPEALMLGFMTNEGSLSWQFLVAVFIANFPEAFSAASLLKDQGVKTSKIMAMWTSVFVITGVLAFLGSWAMPENVTEGSTLYKVRSSSTAGLEGLTGGAMLAMVSTAMLPEAFHGAGDLAGCIFVLGFTLSVLLQTIGIKFGGPQAQTE